MSERWASFDCYGTLIDWNAGVRAALADVWPGADVDALLARYHELEPRLQEGRGVAYRQVLTEALGAIGAAEGLAVPPGRATALAESLPSWPVFPEVHDALAALRAGGWKIAILSNTDPDYLDASIRAIGVEVDLRVVASAIGSYKPAFVHWETFFRQSGADRARHVHVAASLFHDVAPCASLGLPCVWINREHDVSYLPRAGELPDLCDLPGTLERLLPGG
jgi:2-haloacid dehalogenase